MCNKSVWLALTTMGLLVASSALRAQVVNLAQNPSFEEDEVILDDPTWTRWATWGAEGGLSSTVAFDNEEFIDGARSLRIMPKGTTDWHFIVLNLPIPTEAGKRYTASFWAKAKEPRSLAAKFKATDNTVDWGQTAFQLTTEWAEYAMTSAAQSASTKVEFFCSGSEVVLWLDFFYVYAGDYVAGIEPSEIAGFGKARRPAPTDGAADVPRDVVLSWTPGKETQGRNVYLGTDMATVKNADAASPSGVLVVAGLAEATYAPADLQYGRTYYWRVDEISAGPDSAVLKGDVWQFTVEPYAYPVADVKATASSAQPNMGPQNTVNASGLNADDQHSTESTHMWMTDGSKPAWIQFEFGQAHKLHEMWVWNSNQLIEEFIGFGAKTVVIEYSVDGAAWATLEGVPEFAKATGTPTYTANTRVSFNGVTARFVKLTINANWGGAAKQTGLAEVRFFYLPVQAREPVPADGAAGVALDTELNWRPGREAASHKVFFGSDEDAVAAGAAAPGIVTEHRYTPAMNFGTRYFWRVDEVGEAITYPGNVWSFTSQEFATIDDFEAYNDDDNRIYDVWIDGMATGASGSTVGYMDAPFAEKTIIHSGKQSMPLAYDNRNAPFVSEAEREFATPQDWTGSGATELCVWTRGYPALARVAVTEAGGKMTLTGAGADIWNNSDEFTYAYKTLTGDGSLIARVTSNGAGSDTWAKGGVMIRETVNGGSMHAMMVITGGGGNGASFQYRSATNGASGNSDIATVVAPPYWVKIERVGGVFSGYVSADGKAWNVVGQQLIPVTDPVLIGLCVTSHVAGVDRTFQFENISAAGGVSGNWQGAVVNSPVYNDPADMYLVVTDSASKSATAASATAATAADWTAWKIPMSSLTGVNLARVKKLTIGIGNKATQTAGGSGIVFIDDLGYGRTAP